MTTLAELNARTISGLGTPEPEVCSLSDSHNAVVQALSLRTAQTTLFGNSVLSQSKDFHPTTADYDITSLIGSGSPVALEIKDDNTRYVAARFCGFESVGENGFRDAYSFYTQGTSETGELRQFIRFNTVPEAECRILYDADAVKKQMQDVMNFPEYISELIVLEAQNSLIPKIKLRYALNFSRNEQERKDAGAILGAYDGIYAVNMSKIPALENLWRVWSFGENKRESGFTKRVPNSRRLYGD